MTYPVQLTVASPARFDRLQLLLRLVIALALGFFGVSAGWLGGLLFVVLPMLAAIVVSTGGAPHYLTETGPGLWRAIGWLLTFSAYMMLLIDRFPVGEPAGVRIELQMTGRPTTGSTLLRLLSSIPSAFVLCLLGVVSSVLFVVGVVTILVDRRVPAGILSFQRGVVGWQARLLAYHASLVDEYPPFSFEATPLHPGDRASVA